MALLLSLGLLACTTPESPPEAAPPPPAEALPPNILLIDIDSLRLDRFEENKRQVAPALHALQDRSVVFEAAYAPSGWTAPSLGALLTGRFPHLEPNAAGELKAWTPTLEGLPTLPEVLGYYEYQTAVFWGITHQGLLAKSSRGFQHSTRWTPGHGSSYDADVVSWLHEFAEPPFFAMVHNVDLHRPMPRVGTSPTQATLDALPRCLVKDLGESAQLLSQRADQATGARAMARRYDCGLSFYDGSVARILAALEAAGFADDTIVVVTTNHGELLLEHGVVGHELLYEPVLHIPLLVFDPRHPEPRRLDELVELQDLAPTILAWAGAVPPREMHGRSLLPLLEGEGEPAGDLQPLSDLFAMTSMGNAAIRAGHHKLILADDSLKDGVSKVTWSGSMRSGSWMELYDLQADPAELVDLSTGLPELASELEGRLLAWQAERYIRSDEPLEPMDPALEAALKERGYWDAVVAPEKEP